MDRLHPPPSACVEPADAAAGPRSPVGDRPWVMVNMVASIDGAAALGGLSAGLSCRADKSMFSALRQQADIILVGAKTAVAEQYAAPRSSGARVAVVSGALSVDADLPLFRPRAAEAAEGRAVPLVVTTADADGAAARALAGRAELIRAGRGSVDLPAALRRLRALGARVVLCEGGPTLNAALLADDLIDELNLTLAPLAVGAAAPRIIEPGSGPGPDFAQRAYTLTQVVTDQGALFLRWVRSSE